MTILGIEKASWLLKYVCMHVLSSHACESFLSWGLTISFSPHTLKFLEAIASLVVTFSLTHSVMSHFLKSYCTRNALHKKKQKLSNTSLYIPPSTNLYHPKPDQPNLFDLVHTIILAHYTLLSFTNLYYPMLMI